MKIHDDIKLCFAAVGLAAMFLLCSCQTTSPRQAVSDSIPYIQPITEAISVAALTLGIKDESERTEVANQMYAIAVGVRSLSGGAVPTTEQLQAAIISFGGSRSRYASLAQSVAGLYSSYFQSVKGDPKLVLDVLEQLARGCENAAAQVAKLEVQ